MIEFNSSTPGYEWLSNFYLAPITGPSGRVWPSTEHAYQAMKSTSQEEQELIRQAATAKQAKHLSYKIKHKRADWHQVNIKLMKRLIRDKFSQHPELKAKLLATGDEELVHLVYWNDKFWGRNRQGVGENWQGRLTMEVREELRREECK